MSASPAPLPLPDPVARWRDALDNLSPHASPCRYLAPAKWAAIREDAIAFCDKHGAGAHRLGWTAAELFAVHPEHGRIRLDACGMPMIEGQPETTGCNHLKKPSYDVTPN